MILIVDDNQDLGTVLQRLLEYVGYDALAVSSGKRALEEMIAAPPSLLVLDYHMPEMDGMEVLRRVRSSREWRAVPVLVYTADAAETVRSKAMALGATDVMLKHGPYFDRLVDRACELAGPPPSVEATRV